MSPLLHEKLPLSDRAGRQTAAAEAVQAARAAFAGWKELSFRQRAVHLEKVRRLLTRRADAVARVVSEENGKPLTEVLGAEILGSAEMLRVLLREGGAWIAPRTIPCRLSDRLRGVRHVRLLYEPMGVIGIIGTWNYPLLINLRQIASALLCGNAVVWKPSEHSPRTAAVVEEIFREAGLPAGVFTVLPAQRQAGVDLVSAGCEKIVFTGHAATGRRILKELADKGIPSIMELSGMDAALVCEDADLEKAVRGLCWASMTNAGQSCVAPRRLIVRREIVPAFRSAFAEAVRSLKVGDPLDPETEIGPLRTLEQAKQLEELIRDAVSKGAELVAGGRWREAAGKPFFEPTVLTGLNETMAIVQEEFFGPVSLLYAARDDRELTVLANAGPYGLGASIWTMDLRRAERLAGAVHAGIVWINEALVSAGNARYPFGGTKQSGFGRVGGAEGMRQLMNVKCLEISGPGGFRPYYFPYSREKVKQLFQIIRWRG
ncbi:MAG: aldehyde dehydrogenase family protein [Candidatus Omnitrophica bacterium]|nr:aldehyde dehydrogenase family protein [Candidatus Omnitrophota bacterium]